MPIFAIHYTYPDDTTELMTVRPAHRQWLSSLPGLLVAGMYQDGLDEVSAGEPTEQSPRQAALIIVAAESMAAVIETFDHDPYWLGGLVLRRVVREWNPPLGSWVADAASPLG